MMCDIILVGEGAQFGHSESTLYTIHGMGGSQRLIREVVKSRAMEMILNGKHLMNAYEAAQRGLVACVVTLFIVIGIQKHFCTVCE
jgi:enoyl-CoA hydratase